MTLDDMAAFVETDVNRTDLETILQNLASGEYSKPVRIVAFNLSEGWSRDVTQDMGLSWWRAFNRAKSP